MRMGKREETVRNFGRGKNSGARKGSDGERRFGAGRNPGAGKNSGEGRNPGTGKNSGAGRRFGAGKNVGTERKPAMRKDLAIRKKAGEEGQRGAEGKTGTEGKAASRGYFGGEGRAPLARGRFAADQSGKKGKIQAEERNAARSKWEIEKGKGRCRAFGECGGCQMLHLPYQEQLTLKEKETAKLLKPYVRLEGIIGMEQPERYRNKVNAAFTHDRQGKPLSGVYKEGTHYIIPIEECVLENEKADAIIASIRSLLPSFKIKTFDEDTGYGLLRHVMVRVAHATGQIMVVLVLGSPILPSKNNFVKALLKLHPDITTIVINVNEKKTSMVLGDNGQVIYGKGYIEDVLCGIHFKISPKSFYQVNSVQTAKLYHKAMEYAGLTGRETVLDTYCGIGTIGLIAAGKARNVIGVELNGDAVKDAVANARRNKIKNVDFYQMDAGEFMVQMAEQGERVDTVFMDPPRTGSDEVFLDALVKLAPDKVVYISCSPETLARDLEYMTKRGYRAARGICVDMFPFCGHVESIVLLSKLKSNKLKHINVELEMDELDLTAAESKVTYEVIKDYVLKQSGLKVSNLYIAQIKQKCGIIERTNYNLPKSENSRQPQCPAEKEQAIVAALKHFGIV